VKVFQLNPLPSLRPARFAAFVLPSVVYVFAIFEQASLCLLLFVLGFMRCVRKRKTNERKKQNRHGSWTVEQQPIIARVELI
jgi:hypothetical protein